MKTDEQSLIRSAQKGDHEAFAALVASCQSRVIQVAYGYLHDRDEAQDAAQEAFIKAYRAIRRFNRTSTFWTWVYRITCNLCKDRLRRRARRPESSLESLIQSAGDLPVPDGQPSPRATASDREMEGLVYRLLQELPEKHIKVLILREFGQMSYEEIAKTVGCRVGTVMSRLFHARRNLATALEPYREALLLGEDPSTDEREDTTG